MNRQAFTPEEVAQGLLQDLLNYLLKYNYKCESGYYEIHITSDSFCTIVEWEDVPYDKSWGGTFKYVDENHVVMKEVIFPDNHSEYLFDEEEQEAIDEWLKENPGWKRNEFGTWYNEAECQQLKEELLK